MGKYYQKILTKYLSPLIWQTGIDKLFRFNYGGRGSILMFHRVVLPQTIPRIHNHLSLEVSPELLSNTIKYFKDNKYEFINLDILPEWLETNRDNQKKFVVFTFDDGYRDNLEIAYPIFKKWQVPFTIYVTTSLPDNNSILWWYILEDIILKNETLIFPANVDVLKISCPTIIKKEQAFNRIRSIIMSYSEIERDLKVKKFAELNNYDPTFQNKIALTWPEIKQLSEDSLVTIGAHTINHYNLCSINFADAKKEILDSKILIENKIGKKVNHFSYPLGKFNQELVDYTKTLFKTATTTKNANIFPLHANIQHTLPRISVNSLTTEKVLRLQVNGFFPALVNKFKK